MSELKTSTQEGLQPQVAKQPESNTTPPKPRDKMAARIDADPRIKNTEPQTIARGDALEAVYKDIKAYQLQKIANDSRVVEAQSLPNSNDTADITGRVAREVWGRFAAENPSLADEFARRDTGVNASINSFVAEQSAFILREAERMADQAGAPKKENIDVREAASNNAIAEAIRKDPDLGRLLAEKAEDPRFKAEYSRYISSQERIKNLVADRAQEVASTQGADAGLSTLASKEEWDREFNRLTNNTQNESNPPVQPEAPTANPQTTEMQRRRSEAARKAAWTRNFNKLESNQPVPEVPQAEVESTTQDKSSVETPIEDRLSEAASDKVAAQRALQEARRRGASDEVIATLEKNAADAESYYNQSVVDRNQAITESRFAGIESTLQEILSRLDSSAPTPKDASIPNPNTSTVERPSNASKEALQAFQIAQLQAEIASLKDTVMKTSQYLNETDPTKKRTLLAELIALTGAVIAEAAGSTAEIATSQRLD